MENRFAIVNFTETNDVAVVPLKWVKDNSCAWPPVKSQERIIHYTKKLLDVDEESWSFYPAKIIQTFDTYDAARKKLKKAENSSDLNTDCEDIGRGKRRKVKKMFFTSSSEESGEETWTDRQQFTNTGIDKLPSPPSRLSPPIKEVRQRSRSPVAQSSRPSCSPRETSYQDTHLRRLQLGSPMESTEKEFRKEVLRQLALLRASVNSNRDMLEAILNSTGNRNTDREANQDEVDFDPARLPMKTEESLRNLEEELRDNSFKNNIVNYLSKIGGNNVNDVTKRIMKRLISDEVAKDYSWFGAKGKKKFSILQSAKVLEEAVKKVFPKEATEKAIEEATKNWLRHAPERLTGRQKRGNSNERSAGSRDLIIRPGTSRALDYLEPN